MGTLAEGIKEIFATAKTNGSNIMLCGNDGTPDGHMTMNNLASVLGAAMPNGFNTIILQSGSVWSLNNSLVKNISPTGASAISDDYWRIPYGATKVRIKSGSYSTKVYFYTSRREYAGSTGSTYTEAEYDIPNNAVYALVSLENCTPQQMLSDMYQITFLDYLGSYGNLGSLASVMGVAPLSFSENGAGFIGTGTWLFGAYTTDYTEYYVLLNSRPSEESPVNGAATLLKRGNAAVIGNVLGSISMNNPTEGKTYIYFKLKLFQE